MKKFVAYTDAERAAAFWDKVCKTDSCWEWMACRFPLGYGLAWWDGRNRLAHVVSYELSFGPVPEGLELDHLCRNRSCVRPDHLEPVTHKTNVRRGLLFKNATHCPHGHPYDEKNTYTSRFGHKYCRTCRRDLSRKNHKRYHANKKASLLRRQLILGGK